MQATYLSDSTYQQSATILGMAIMKTATTIYLALHRIR
ncbi:Uncharacterised protein [Sphingobacterium multivorum]|nr:Uncharacterised protein [Sphingobacterium multivorum]